MKTAIYARGQLVFAKIPPLNDNGDRITKALTTFKKIGRHVVIICSVKNQEAQEDKDVKDGKAGKAGKAGKDEEPSITGYLITTFGDAEKLSTRFDAADFKWFLPIDPATKESIHEVVKSSIAGPGAEDVPQWVNLKDRVTIENYKIKMSVGEISSEDVETVENAVLAAHAAP